MRLIEKIARQLCKDYQMDADAPARMDQGEPPRLMWEVMSPMVVEVMSASAKVLLAEIEK